MLVFYLVGLGLSESQTGLLLTATLIGDTVVSLYLTTRADRIGRRRMLIVGAALMIAAGLTFASTTSLWLLIVAGTIGVISPSGNEVGPFLSIEQAALSHVVTDRTRTEVFAWYTLTGSLATALGALTGGMVTHALQQTAMTPVNSYRMVVMLYAALGALLAVLFTRLSPAAEASTHGEKSVFRATLAGLSGHRSLAQGGVQALEPVRAGCVRRRLRHPELRGVLVLPAVRREPGTLGVVFFSANVLAGMSALLASRLANRFGLLNTMVATHLPSNILLILVPLMPNLPLAVLVLLVRFSISQMDVPTRMSYVMAVVSPEERSAAAGITGVARTIGAAISPLFVGLLFARPSLIDVPFFVAGTLKILYDVLLYRAFKAVQPPEEAVR